MGPTLKNPALTTKLSLPSQSVVNLSFTETSLKGLQDFRESLPGANLPESLARLYQYLPEVAGLLANGETKLALLDYLKPVIFDYTDKVITTTAISREKTKEISLTLGLLKQLGNGYKAVLMDELDKTAPEALILARAIAASIGTLQKRITSCWRTYISPPRKDWIEIHTLYQIAQTEGVEVFQPDAETGTPAPDFVTPKAAYLSILTASCSDPGRLSQQDQRQLIDFLANCADLATLSPEPGQGPFRVDPGADEGPVRAGAGDDTREGLLYIDFARLIGHLETCASDCPLPHRLITDLVQHLNQPPTRTEIRSPDDSTCSALFGLTRLHRQLTHTRNIEEYLRGLKIELRRRPEKQAFSARDTKPELKDLWLDGALEARSSVLYRTERPKKDLDKPIEFSRDNNQRQFAAAGPDDIEAVRIDISDNGTCLELPTAQTHASPGDLAAIRPDTGNHWALAMVRWTRVTPKLSRLVGLELLKYDYKPCAAALTRKQKQTSAYFSCLLLKGSGADLELLSPSIPFTEGSEVVIVSASGKQFAILQSTCDSSYHVSRFKLTMLTPETGV